MRISDWSSDVCSSDLSLPTEPTMLTLPMDWPRPPIESRYIGQKDRKAILAKGACAYCGSASGPFHIDHVKPDRKSVGSGQSVSVRVDLGGRRLIKKKKCQANVCRYSYSSKISN